MIYLAPITAGVLCLVICAFNFVKLFVIMCISQQHYGKTVTVAFIVVKLS